jgi:hypothetical protein
MSVPGHEPVAFEDKEFSLASNDILAPVRQALEDAAVFTGGNNLGHYAAQWAEAVSMLELNPTCIPWDRSLWETHATLIERAAGVILQQPAAAEQASEEKRVHDLINSSLGIGANDEGLSHLPSAVLCSVEVVRELRQLSSRIITPLNSEDPSDEYELMKLLSVDYIYPNPPEDKREIFCASNYILL